LTRLMTLIATVTLTAAVLFRLPSDFRIGVCIIVSVAATVLAIRSLFTRNLPWAVLFLAVLGIFTPFQLGRFSHMLISVFDMATLALFAASPLIFRKSTRPVALSAPRGRL